MEENLISFLRTLEVMAEIVGAIRDLRTDMKKLIETLGKLNDGLMNLDKATAALTKLNEGLAQLDKATATIDSLQKTFGSNQENLEKLITELHDSNTNFKSIIDALKEMKGD
jgi:flagellin-like hook-associated protein FlgL